MFNVSNRNKNINDGKLLLIISKRRFFLKTEFLIIEDILRKTEPTITIRSRRSTIQNIDGTTVRDGFVFINYLNLGFFVFDFFRVDLPTKYELIV